MLISSLAVLSMFLIIKRQNLLIDGGELVEAGLELNDVEPGVQQGEWESGRDQEPKNSVDESDPLLSKTIHANSPSISVHSILHCLQNSDVDNDVDSNHNMGDNMNGNTDDGMDNVVADDDMDSSTDDEDGSADDDGDDSKDDSKDDDMDGSVNVDGDGNMHNNVDHNVDDDCYLDSTVFYSAYLPLSSEVVVDASSPVPAAHIPETPRRRGEAKVSEEEPPDALVVPKKTGVVGNHAKLAALSQDSSDDGGQEHYRFDSTSLEDDSDQQRFYHSQETDSEYPEGAEMITPTPSKVTRTGHKGNTSLCKLEVREECGPRGSSISGPLNQLPSPYSFAAGAHGVCSPNPPPSTYGVHALTSEAPNNAGVDTNITILDTSALGMNVSIVGPEFSTDDIQLQAEPLLDSPEEISADEEECCFDHEELKLQPFQGQYGWP
jgi:hypothetical protein